METDDSPARIFDPYFLNETLVDRLSLLNYESEFVPLRDDFKAIPRHYFVKPTNAGEQWYLFTNLAVWLMKKKGEESLEYPQVSDDPNQVITTILATLKAEDIPVDYSISAIKKGSGNACLHILTELAALALKASMFGFQQFQIADGEGGDADEDAEGGQESAEITAEQFDDEDNTSVVDEDFGEATQFDTLFDESALLTLEGGSEKPLDYLNASDTQAPQFRAEVERATPQLKITIRADAKDWRSHVDQLGKQLQSLKSHFGTAKPFLTETQQEITESSQRIEARERHINQQLANLMSQYRTVQDRIAEKNEQYREASGGLTTRTDTLQTLNEEAEQLKAQIEEQAARSADVAPLVRIKAAMQKLEDQIATMSIQTAVIEQSLFNRRIRNAAHHSSLLAFNESFN